MASVLGIHEQALLVREKRSEILASNLVNADTPNYKARDLDFKAILANQTKSDSANKLQKTNQYHLSGYAEKNANELKYRVPMQASFDGNTVDSQIEQTQFTENSMQYMASLNFLNSRVSQLLTALKGD